MDFIDLVIETKYGQYKRQERYNKKNSARRIKRLQKQQRIYPDLLISIHDKQNERTETVINNTVDLHDDDFIGQHEYEARTLNQSTESTLENHKENNEDIISNSTFQIYNDSEQDERGLSNDDEDSNEASMLPLHYYTNNVTLDYCEKFAILARQSNLSKLHTNAFLSFIKSGLPVPNNMPSTEKEIRDILGVQDLFTKRCLCLLCSFNFDYKQITCPRCSTSDKTLVAFM